MKDVRSQDEGGCPCGHFVDKAEGFHKRDGRLNFLHEKIRIKKKLCYVRSNFRRLRHFGHFTDKGCQISQFCADALCGRGLMGSLPI